MKYYFYVAFYEEGLMRMFNTKNKPKPMNIHNGKKLLKVCKFSKKI